MLIFIDVVILGEGDFGVGLVVGYLNVDFDELGFKFFFENVKG